MTTFKDLNLNPTILAALEKKGYTIPTPIQAGAIGHILEKKDFLGIAQTGTGKTAAFSLPIIQNLTEKNVTVRPNHVRCLILTPTRELASQIAENIELYGVQSNLKHAVIFGGVGENPQIKNLQKGLDIVIATPGRLLDLMNQGHVRFMDLEIFVLDEADRMLDMGFINDIKKIIAKLPKERQTLFFSATMPSTISQLAHSILNNPIKVEITPPATTVERIAQKVYFVERSNKPLLLKDVLLQDQVHSTLVFIRTKHSANRLIDFLSKHGIKADAIHGDRSQSARETALANFRSGKTKVLIATDIAARGIDVPGISHVINYDIPMDPESYVHRIGRTARAGKDGIAISFCDPTERLMLKSVEKTIRYQIPVDESHVFHGVSGVSGVRKLASGQKRAISDGLPPEKPRVAGRALSRGTGGSAPSDSRFGGERRERTERSDRPQRSSGDRFERSDRPQRSDRPERSERPERNGNVERSERPSRGNDRFEGRGERKPFDSSRPRREGDRSERKPFGDRKPFHAKSEGGFKKVAEKLGNFFGYKKSGNKDVAVRDTLVDRDKNGKNYAKKRPFGSRHSNSKFGGNKPR
jgi:ATP-dependent RNA helicase RhlE